MAAQLGSCSLVNMTGSGCSWLLPEVIRIFHILSKHLTDCLSRDHSLPSSPWPRAWTLKTFKPEDQILPPNFNLQPSLPCCYNPTCPLFSPMLPMYGLPPSIGGRSFFIIQTLMPSHFQIFGSSKTEVKPSVSSGRYNKIPKRMA